MWLPKKVYDSLPWAYITIGLLFVAGVFYLGYGDFDSGFYFAFGVMSIASGLVVYYVRSNRRSRQGGGSQGDTAAG